MTPGIEIERNSYSARLRLFSDLSVYMLGSSSLYDEIYGNLNAQTWDPYSRKIYDLTLLSLQTLVFINFCLIKPEPTHTQRSFRLNNNPIIRS